MKAEIRQKRTTLPTHIVTLVLVFGITAYGASLALGDVDRPDRQPTVQRALASAIGNGEQLYVTNCMSCHMADGSGVPGVFPPLVGTDWVTGDKGRLIRITIGGLTGEIEVDGNIYNGAMPPWGPFLDDEQAAKLLTYIRTSWGNAASPVTPEEVSRVRAATKDRTSPWTAAELLDDKHTGIPGDD